MKNSIQDITTSIVYKCNFCGLLQEFSLRQYIEHLDISHGEIDHREQSEAIMQISSQIHRASKQKTPIIRHPKTSNFKVKKIKLKKEIEQRKFEETKKQVLRIIEDYNIRKNKILNVQSAKNMRALQNIIDLISEKNIEVKEKFVSTGITVRKRPKYQKKAPRSLWLIYTPMGNKR